MLYTNKSSTKDFFYRTIFFRKKKAFEAILGKMFKKKIAFKQNLGVLHQRGSEMKSLTCNPGVLGLSCTTSSEFLVSFLGQDTSEPQPSTGGTQQRHE